MSIEMNIKSPSKKELAEIIRRIADLIVVSSNETVIVTFSVKFVTEDC